MKAKALLVVVTVALVGSLIFTACASEEKPSIKIGVLASLTGSFATMDTEALNGMKLAFSEVNYEVAGQQIELVVEDIGVDPGLCLTKIRKLKEMDNVDLVLGPVASYQILAIREYIHENKVLTISHMAPTPEMMGDKYTEYFFRSSYNYDQENAVAGYIAYEVKGYRKAVAIFMDIADGEGNWEPFKEVFEGLGGTVVQEIRTPMDCLDYGPYMAQIDVNNADFIWSFHVGGDAIRFVNALKDYGIKNKLPVFCSPATVSEGWLYPMGDSALGIESATNYSPVLDTAENEWFVQAVWDNLQQEATIPLEHGYVAAKMVVLALQKVNGNVEDLDSLIEAMEDLEFEAPRGPIKLEKHSPVQNIYHRVVEMVDGKLQNTVLDDVYPDIEPSWLPPELEQTQGG